MKSIFKVSSNLTAPLFNAAKPILKASATRSYFENYQKLLKSDFTNETLRSVSALLWKLIAYPEQAIAFGSDSVWQKVLVYPPKATQKPVLDPFVIDTLRQAAYFLGDKRLPAMPAKFSEAPPGRLVMQAQQVWTYLGLQLLVQLTGEKELFADLQSLLFLCAIEGLLPNLKQKGLLPEHDFLLNALFIHSIIVWREEPSHQYYLQSALMDYLEEYPSMLELRKRSLQLTDVEDHSYLTKAQAVWSDLIDLGEHEEAYAFLFHLNRYTPQSYQPEIEGMLAATIKLTGSLKK